MERVLVNCGTILSDLTFMWLESKRRSRGQKKFFLRNNRQIFSKLDGNYKSTDLIRSINFKQKKHEENYTKQSCQGDSLKKR